MCCLSRFISIAALAATATAAVGPPAQSASVTTIVFTDHTYADADWSVVHSFGLVSAGQVTTGGNLGSYRQVALGVGELASLVGTSSTILPRAERSPG
jgi:hypothetical protein